jgi:hypothetical protein
MELDPYVPVGLASPTTALDTGVGGWDHLRSRLYMQGEWTMPSNIEYRILENVPGWYWEVIDGREVIARGVAPSQKDACAQAAEAERKMESAGVPPSRPDKPTSQVNS